jgi:hypothetical protein
VQIVDRQQQRRLRAPVERQPVEPVKRREGGVVKLVAVSAGHAEDRSGAGGRAGQQLVATVRRHKPLEQLPDDTEREVALELAAACREDGPTVVGGPRTELREQPRLADARLALDQDRAPRTQPRVRQQRRERAELRVALEQVRSGHRGIVCAAGGTPPPSST